MCLRTFKTLKSLIENTVSSKNCYNIQTYYLACQSKAAVRWRDRSYSYAYYILHKNRDTVFLLSGRWFSISQLVLNTLSGHNFFSQSCPRTIVQFAGISEWAWWMWKSCFRCAESTQVKQYCVPDLLFNFVCTTCGMKSMKYEKCWLKKNWILVLASETQTDSRRVSNKFYSHYCKNIVLFFTSNYQY